MNASSNPLDETKEAKCHHCGTSFQSPTMFGRAIAICCSDACVDAEKSKRGLDEFGNPIKLHAPLTGWAALCPPRYARFDASKLPPRGKAVAARVLAWNPFQTPGQGIALIGESDGGKSMLIHEAAHNAYNAGFDVFCTLSTEFAWKCGDMDARKDYMNRCMNCAILLLDDVGKEKLTERVESDLFHVLEHRERWDKAIIWSANSKGSTLRAGMSEDRADPILNRLRRIAEVIAV